MEEPRKSVPVAGETIACPNCDEETLTYDAERELWECTNDDCRYLEEE